MKYHPLVCSAWEVQAFLDGSKTQFRRAMKDQPHSSVTELSFIGSRGPSMNYFYDWMSVGQGEESQFWRCPFGQPGDRLWVRECWRQGTPAWNGPDFDSEVRYRIDQSEWPPCEWQDATTMPQWASRITLEVVDVRGVRVQEISEEDIIAEGIESLGWHWAASSEAGAGRFLYWERDEAPPEPWMSSCETAHDIYRWLWDSDNAKRGPAFCFAANPWVWTGEVRRIEP